MLTRGLLLFAASLAVLGCARPRAATPTTPVEQPIRLIEHGIPAPAGTRLAIQFDKEPPVVHVADGRGGPPILYHGRELHSDQLKSIIILKTKEARERFGDQSLDAAILIELK